MCLRAAASAKPKPNDDHNKSMFLFGVWNGDRERERIIQIGTAECRSAKLRSAPPVAIVLSLTLSASAPLLLLRRSDPMSTMIDDE